MFRKIVNDRTTGGVRAAVKKLWMEVRIQHRHYSSIKKVKRLSVEGNLKLNLGCGRNIKTGWINIDLFEEKADLQLDLREEFPFPDESVAIIYSEHFFEHLEYPEEALKFLRESLRVLVPGGIFSVAVPDTEWTLTSYLTGDEEYFRIAKKLWHPKWCDTRLHHVNYHFRQGREHKYAYDFETLAKVFAQVGFVSIVKRSFNPDLDSIRRVFGTLYLDAKKPGN